MHTGALCGGRPPTGRALAVETMTVVVVLGHGGRRDVGARHTQAGPGAYVAWDGGGCNISCKRVSDVAKYRYLLNTFRCNSRGTGLEV